LENRSIGGTAVLRDPCARVVDLEVEHLNREALGAEIGLQVRGAVAGRRPAGSGASQVLQASEDTLCLLVDGGAVRLQLPADPGKRSVHVDPQGLGQLACDKKKSDHQRLVLEEIWR